MPTEFFHVQEHVIDSQHIREYPDATRKEQEEVLQIHIKQYVPLDSMAILPGAVTIIGAHANGFPKVLDMNSPNNCTAFTFYRSSMNPYGTRYTGDRRTVAFPFALSGSPM